MATGKKYYWLKLQKDFFKEHYIKIIERTNPSFLIIYLKLMAESISHEGNLRFSDEIPYNNLMLSAAIDEDEHVFADACSLFFALKLMEIKEDGTFFMTEVFKMLGGESESRQRVADWREERKEIHQHIPRIETHINNKRYGGNYYKAFKRDNMSCQICGNKEYLIMHHVLKYDPEDTDTVCLENLVTLCPSCHVTLHKNNEQAELPPKPILGIIGLLNNESVMFKLSHVSYGKLNVTQEYRDKSIEIRDKSIDNVLKIDNSITKTNVNGNGSRGTFLKIKDAPNVLISQEEKDILIEKWGHANIKTLVLELNDYILSEGKQYKNHFGTLSAWARKRGWAEVNSNKREEGLVEHKKAKEEESAQIEKKLKITKDKKSNQQLYDEIKIPHLKKMFFESLPAEEREKISV